MVDISYFDVLQHNIEYEWRKYNELLNRNILHLVVIFPFSQLHWSYLVFPVNLVHPVWKTPASTLHYLYVSSSLRFFKIVFKING